MQVLHRLTHHDSILLFVGPVQAHDFWRPRVFYKRTPAINKHLGWPVQHSR